MVLSGRIRQYPVSYTHLFFQSGTANVYDEDEKGNLIVTTSNAPYTTRILVRRPADKKKFSGNVIVEVLNASAMFDIDRDWILLWKKIVRDGDIYIGITSKGHVVDLSLIHIYPLSMLSA